MRSADATTLVRVLLIVFVAYLILGKYNPIAIIILIAVAMLLDAVDGFFAVNEASNGAVGPFAYIKSVLGDKASVHTVQGFKKKLAKTAKFGPRIDVAGDRAVEYILWVVYTVAGVIPIFVLFIVIIRHSFVDAFMAAKGTSSKMKTRFARVIYSSNLWRGGINVVKFLTFSYLSLVYIWSYPEWIGYVLVTILVSYILLRGAAELYEAYA
ncbi:MAG: CDP-alcohol phosphatidyltransferase family protein [Candidatus Micrarchaeaceae archaeon]